MYERDPRVWEELFQQHSFIQRHAQFICNCEGWSGRSDRILLEPKSRGVSAL